MSRLLKTSGFVGLTVQMIWGMSNVAFLIGGPPQFFNEWIGAHAHFGVLGILAVATGLAVTHYDVTGTRKQIVEYGFIIGQWLLPLTIVAEGVTGVMQLGMLAFLWGLCLLAAMGTMAVEAWNEEPAAAGV